jgi:TonB family protein
LSTFALLALPCLAQQPIQRADPEYSDEALIAGLEGTVQLSGTLSAEGVLADLRVTHPLGLGLDEKALDAATQWRYAPSTPAPVEVPIDFNLPSKFSRWHLIGATFDLPAGVQRPIFVRANYPLGAGITPNAYEEGRLLGAIGRPANATIAFEIDDHGKPARFEIVKSSYDVWGFEAANLVAGWQFTPGTKDGLPVPVRCTLDLVWGPETLTPSTIAVQLNSLHPQPPHPTVGPIPQNAPEILEKTEPTYTEQARAAGLEGVMWVSFQVGDDGSPRDVKVLEHLALGLDDQAIQAISKWRFKPASLNGQPIASYAVAELFFQLTGVTSSLVNPGLPTPKAAPPK